MSTDGESFAGRTLEEAVERAAAALAAARHELLYEVVGGAEDGNVRIRAGLDPVAVVRGFLMALCQRGGLELELRLGSEGDEVVGELTGNDARLLTAGGGRGLDALQYLCNRVLNRRLQHHPPVRLDSQGFKDRRARTLQEAAESAADEALRGQRAVVLGPYTPAARREIHLALADDPAVETESDGEGFLKRVVVRPRRRH